MPRPLKREGPIGYFRRFYRAYRESGYGRLESLQAGLTMARAMRKINRVVVRR